MHSGEIETGEQLNLFSRRKYSMSPASRFLILGSLAFVTLAISLGFAVQGAWPVLPFAGLECGALFLAFRWLQRHEGDYEWIAIDAESVVVECCAGGKIERIRFNRIWAQVVVENQSPGRTRLILRSHGREFEVGKLLTGEAKRTVAKRIRERLSGRAVHKD